MEDEPTPNENTSLIEAIVESMKKNRDEVLASNITEAIEVSTEKQAHLLATTITCNAKENMPTIVTFCAAMCCCSVLGITFLAANITAFVGLAHTHQTDLDPLCPPYYWDASIILLLTRLAVFSLLGCTVCTSNTSSRNVFCTASAVLCMLTTVFTFAVVESIVNVQAWSALNCSTAVRGRDADPLLIASGSIFVLVDWIMLICACCLSSNACCRRADMCYQLD